MLLFNDLADYFWCDLLMRLRHYDYLYGVIIHVKIANSQLILCKLHSVINIHHLTKKRWRQFTSVLKCFT